MSFIYRTHEWIADRVKFVQYPNVRGPKKAFWKNEMPWQYRLFMITSSLILLLFLGFLLTVISVLLWAFLS